MRSPSSAPDPSSTVLQPRPAFPRTSPGPVEPPTRAWLERAIELALFILDDREMALEAATRALARLRVTVIAQDRRSAYVPRGRRATDGVARATRTRVCLSDFHLLQRLVYLETDADERRQEETGAVSEAVLTRRFVKHLVRCAMRRNSFYVTLAMSRLLHRYSTAEAQDLYTLVLQDPGRVPDDHYYRARKRQLIDELRARFADRLTLVVGPRGEHRFESCDNPEAWAPLVLGCLERFTPWDSSCTLPREFDARATELPRFAFEGSDPDGEHPVEVDRIHALLHPPCFRRLARALRLSPPDERLDVPRFARPSGGTSFRGPSEEAAMLTDDEWQQALDRLRGGAVSHGERGGVLCVSVDGGPRSKLDLEHGATVSFSASPLAERIDFENEDGTLVASCLLDGAPGPMSLSVAGRRVVIEVTALDPGALRLDVRVPMRVAEPLAAAAALSGALRRLAAALRAGLASPSPRLPLATAAAAAVLAALVVRPNAPPFESPPSLIVAPSVPSAVPPVPQPSAPPTSAQEQAAPADTTRGLALAPRARRLSDVQRVFVREVEPADAASTWRAALAEHLTAGGLAVSAELAEADACLEVKVGRTSPSRVRVHARLVNVAGDVVWTTRVEGKTDDVSTIAAKVILELTRAVGR